MLNNKIVLHKAERFINLIREVRSKRKNLDESDYYKGVREGVELMRCRKWLL